MICRVELASFPDLFFGQALAADGDALFAQDGCNSCLGDTVMRTDLLSGFASFVAVRDVFRGLGGQEALRTDFRTFLIR